MFRKKKKTHTQIHTENKKLKKKHTEKNLTDKLTLILLTNMILKVVIVIKTLTFIYTP